MIEIKYEEKEKIDNLYNKVKDILLSKKDNDSFNYEHKQHHLYEESDYPGISKNYFNENGSVEFENINGEIIRIEIRRWHPHKHNGCSGLNGNPCLNAKIYSNEQLIWELEVRSGTLTYHAEVSNIELPINSIKEKEIEHNFEQVKNVKIDNNKSIANAENPIETPILFEEFKRIQNENSSIEHSNEALLAQRDLEIKKETERIIKEYEEKIKQNNDENYSTKKQLKNLEETILNYSTFDLGLLGKCLEQLVSIFEGESFLYREAVHNSKITKHGVMDSWEEDVKTKVKMIIKESKLTNNYNSNSSDNNAIDKLINDGNAIVLEENDFFLRDSDIITIYSLKDNQLISNINFNKFDYVKEFIDNIIQFRFQHNKLKFNEKDILNYMKSFILERKDMILKNQNKKLEEKILKLSI